MLPSISSTFSSWNESAGAANMEILNFQVPANWTFLPPYLPLSRLAILDTDFFIYISIIRRRWLKKRIELRFWTNLFSPTYILHKKKGFSSCVSRELNRLQEDEIFRISIIKSLSFCLTVVLWWINLQSCTIDNAHHFARMLWHVVYSTRV